MAIFFKKGEGPTGQLKSSPEGGLAATISKLNLTVGHFHIQIIEIPVNRGSDNRGSTVLLRLVTLL